MSKWKCGICGSEFENYHAQGFDDIIYCPLCYFKEIYKREQKKTKLLQNQLQQKEDIIKELNDKIEDDKMIIEGNWGCIDNLKKDYNLQKNIIKEVREYIEKASYFQGNKVLNEKDILEILDKENK